MLDFSSVQENDAEDYSLLDTPFKTALEKIVDHDGATENSVEGFVNLDMEPLSDSDTMSQHENAQRSDAVLEAAESLRSLGANERDDNALRTEKDSTTDALQPEHDKPMEDVIPSALAKLSDIRNLWNVPIATIADLVKEKESGELLKFMRDGKTYYHPNYFDLTKSAALQAPTIDTKTERKWFHNALAVIAKNSVVEALCDAGIKVRKYTEVLKRWREMEDLYHCAEEIYHVLSGCNEVDKERLAVKAANWMKMQNFAYAKGPHINTMGFVTRILRYEKNNLKKGAMRMFKERSKGFALYFGSADGSRRQEGFFGNERVARRTVGADGTLHIEYWPDGEELIPMQERWTCNWFKRRKKVKPVTIGESSNTDLLKQLNESVSYTIMTCSLFFIALLLVLYCVANCFLFFLKNYRKN